MEGEKLDKTQQLKRCYECTGTLPNVPAHTRRTLCRKELLIIADICFMSVFIYFSVHIPVRSTFSEEQCPLWQIIVQKYNCFFFWTRSEVNKWTVSASRLCPFSSLLNGHPGRLTIGRDSRTRFGSLTSSILLTWFNNFCVHCANLSSTSMSKEVYVCRIKNSTGSSVNTVTRLRVGDWGSFPGRDKNFFSSQPRPDRLWGPPNLLFNY
jgi:hypothetical protein